MGQLTITEKEHWRTRIAKKIETAIEQLIETTEPGYLDRMRATAENHVCEQFGIAELKVKRDACLERIEKLNEETSRLEGECHELLETMLHKLSGKQGGPKKYGVYRADSEFTRLMGEEQKKVSAQLMAEDELGRRILELQHEEEEMLDTIWLATTSKQLQSLWITLTDVLNQPLTSFQRELLRIKPSANPQE
jgi:hypothetical protein